MTSTPATPDPMMETIGRAVELGRAGDVDTAQRQLIDLWQDAGPSGDPFHRCTLAHYLADLYDHPAEALIWDIRALDAAASLSDERAQAHHHSLQVAGFYPSLHLNIADNLRQLSAFDAAQEHISHAEERSAALTDDGYGRMIRTAIKEVRLAIDRGETARRSSAPGGS
ncbi:hypothetical protein [Brevibacterium spongiae]|uniref:Tetratricopeptide repeat protein n=1 Tax=Brevibacterium spongiae TaxID=2909672 RepID=A0ABY5SJZ4_9MICO|nr:hypothetical protein [Brevibacterium spongiae]UVI34777.1 hypothetical protein L1F31_11640 [Brevibacterium spongiae]